VIDGLTENPRGVIHIGAHNAEEYSSYVDMGIEDVVWIEANPKIASQLAVRLQGDKNMKVVNALISDKNGEKLTLHVTNNGQSSSILELGIHRNLFPYIHVVEDIELESKTLDTVVEEEKIDMSLFNFLSVDIQGAELLALRGATKALAFIDAINTEINTDYVYKECALLHEIDDYLSEFGFSRVATHMWEDHPWGDALYIKSLNKDKEQNNGGRV
jgi:FkbM family methyltransferase